MDEAARHRLHTQLAGVLGAEPASDLMSLLPPVGWADVATKQDLTVLEHGLRIEIAELRTEFRTELGEMRNSMTRLEAKLDGEVNTLRSEFHDFRADMHDALRRQTISLVGVMATFSGITWAMVTFLPA